MASGDRFYQLELSHRPAVWGDVGSLLKIEGIVIGGEGARMILMLPGTAAWDAKPGWAFLSLEEWSDWLRRSDNPEILVPKSLTGSLEKVFHRKLRYEISGAVQQKVWAADGFQCFWCKHKMGKVQLTIDHFTPLELGGANDVSNYLSACRACNKRKGAMDPRTWCALIDGDYDAVLNYLRTRGISGRSVHGDGDGESAIDREELKRQIDAKSDAMKSELDRIRAENGWPTIEQAIAEIESLRYCPRCDCGHLPGQQCPKE